MKSFYHDLDDLLISGQKVVLARIISRKGSAPRSVGAKCLICQNGEVLGTIGGGMLEHQVIEKAGEVLKTGRSAALHFQLSGEEVAETDMLCGGIMDVYLEPVFPDGRTSRDIFTSIRELIPAAGAKAALLTLMADGIDYDCSDGHALVIQDGGGVRVIGRMAAGVVFDPRELLNLDGPELKRTESGETAFFVEPIRAAEMLYIFGAGHISTFLCPLAKRVGFSVVVIDDREAFANQSRFPDADEILVMPFLESFDRLTAAPPAYIVIVTRGHMHDHAVLREALKHDAAYIGMVGSRKKKETIYRALMEEGAPAEILQTVHAPIGLAIGAETPEEIAVSIVAELIRERAQRRKKGNDTHKGFDWPSVSAP